MIGRSFYAAAALLILFLPGLSPASMGDTLGVFDAPGICPTGLAFAGGSLWIADWEEGNLYRLDAGSGEVLQTVRAPCPRPEGLASDGEAL